MEIHEGSAGCPFSDHRIAGRDHRNTVDRVRRNIYHHICYRDRHTYHHTCYHGHHISVRAPYEDRNPKEVEEEAGISFAHPHSDCASSPPRALHRKASPGSQGAGAGRMERKVFRRYSCWGAGRSRSVERAHIRRRIRTVGEADWSRSRFALPSAAVGSCAGRKSWAVVYAAARTLVGWDDHYVDHMHGAVRVEVNCSLDIADRRIGRREEAVERMDCIGSLVAARSAHSGRMSLALTWLFRILRLRLHGCK